MRRIILIMLITLAAGGCIREQRTNCAADMQIGFRFSDRYRAGGYDQRIANNVALYLFKEGRLIDMRVIPFADIQSGKTYLLHKSPEMSGNLRLAAWSVAAGQPWNLIPQYPLGADYDAQSIALEPMRAAENYLPCPVERFIGTLQTQEAADEATVHIVDMVVGCCRIEVNVTDRSGTLGGEASVAVHGTMSNMNLDLQGIDRAVDVIAPCPSPQSDGIHYTTGIFGVLPSAQGATVSVDILSSDAPVATLTVPRSLLPRGAEAGGMMVFDYTLDAPEFFLTVDGFTQKIEIVGM